MSSLKGGNVSMDTGYGFVFEIDGETIEFVSYEEYLEYI